MREKILNALEKHRRQSQNVLLSPFKSMAQLVGVESAVRSGLSEGGVNLKILRKGGDNLDAVSHAKKMGVINKKLFNDKRQSLVYEIGADGEATRMRARRAETVVCSRRRGPRSEHRQIQRACGDA